jgi:23S rRNA (pseudouridine1915-N3)-methyltransferase
MLQELIKNQANEGFQFFVINLLPYFSMKVTILVVGKTDDAFLVEGIEKYLTRLNHYVKAHIKILGPVKNASALEKEILLDKEGEMIIENIKNQGFTILLDEQGENISSSEFANYMHNKMDSGIKSIIFIAGGAFGVSEAVKQTVDFKLSLSKMTFTHQMVRLILAEQLYRCFTIIKGRKYHH